MPGDGLDLARPLGGDLVEERVERLLDERLLDAWRGRAGRLRRWHGGAVGRDGQVEEDGRLADRQLAVERRLERRRAGGGACSPRPSLIEAAKTSRRYGLSAVQVVEDGAPA